MVVSAMIYAILSDAVSPERRGRAFFYLGSMSLLVEMIVPILGSAMMERWNAFVPVAIAFPFEPCALIIMAFIPPTAKQPEESPLIDADASVSVRNDTDSIPSEEDYKPNILSSLKMSILSIFEPQIKTWTLVFRNRNLLLVNLSFLVTTLGRETLNFLVQYCSKRFGWKLAKVNIDTYSHSRILANNETRQTISFLSEHLSTLVFLSSSYQPLAAFSPDRGVCHR